MARARSLLAAVGLGVLAAVASAVAQTAVSRSTQFAFKDDENRLNLLITAGPNGYAVTGSAGAIPVIGGGYCRLSGTYFPSTKLIKARCEVDGREIFLLDGTAVDSYNVTVLMRRPGEETR